jgi:hypothetical protein
VGAPSAGRCLLAYHASSASFSVKRILPIAAAPVALAGLAAAAFTFGHSPAAPATTDAAGLQPAPASTATAALATPQARAAAAQVLSLTRPATAAGPVVRLNVAAPQGKHHAAAPKGKHHRTEAPKYVVQSGDTLASIAQHLYHSPDYWPVLYAANHSQIKYANEITAGQALTVPAKPAKIPSAPKVLAPSAPAAAPMTSYSSASTAGSTTAATDGASDSSASTAGASTASTSTASTGSTSSFQSCVIAAESGGNAQVMNSSGHYGLYQFSASTWAEYGGNPADFGDASAAEQNQVFAAAMAAGGESNWAPYDGC